MSGKSGGMKRRKVLKTTAVSGVSLTGFSTLGGAKQKGGSSPKGKVPKREARIIAKDAVGHIGTRSEFDTWREQGVKSPELFYAKEAEGDAVKYRPRAWIFPIENRGEDVGYIAIDAIQMKSPVLAYGKNEAPQRKVDDAMKVAKANGHSVHKRFLYHGGTRFYVDTTDPSVVDLRGGSVKTLSPVEDHRSLSPVPETEINADPGGGSGPPDWSGGTDDQVSGNVSDYNWTTTDAGGASNTSYGQGPDSWGGWDGCSPIAASMVIGYHEGITESDVDQREALIDRLHDDMNTSDGGNTDFWNVDNGIRNYNEGSYSYYADNQQFWLAGNTRDQIADNNPLVLNMWNGPYSKDKTMFNGHSVAVFGYREENCGWFCNHFYYKAHGGGGNNPDRVLNNNWNKAVITRVWP